MSFHAAFYLALFYRALFYRALFYLALFYLAQVIHAISPHLEISFNTLIRNRGVNIYFPARHICDLLNR